MTFIFQFDTHLPRDTTENEKHSVVEILAEILRFQGAHPIDLGRGDGADRRIGQRERNADPLLTCLRKKPVSETGRNSFTKTKRTSPKKMKKSWMTSV